MVRVNPPFELKGAGMKMGGAASPFGIDHDRAADVVRGLVEAGADWRGLHIYPGIAMPRLGGDRRGAGRERRAGRADRR